MIYYVKSIPLVSWSRDGETAERLLERELNRLLSDGYEVVSVTNSPTDEESVLIIYKLQIPPDNS